MQYGAFALAVVVVCVLGTISVAADETNPPVTLDAVLRVRVDAATLTPSCQFELPGKVDQSFWNHEYRCALLDKNGVQVKEGLIFRQPRRIISLPKDKRSVIDGTDANIRNEKLNPGEEYYFVVSVRNVTGLAKFKAP